MAFRRADGVRMVRSLLWLVVALAKGGSLPRSESLNYGSRRKQVTLPSADFLSLTDLEQRLITN